MKIYHASLMPRSQVKRLATLKGLDKIDYKKTYKLVKLGAKVPSARGYPNKMVALSEGEFFLCGAEQEEQAFVWLIGFSTRGLDGSYFKTSPILSCKEVKGGYKIETENSFYKLEEIKD